MIAKEVDVPNDLDNPSLGSKKEVVEYQNNNSTMRDAFRNKTFSELYKEHKTQEKLSDAIDKAYVDIEKTDVAVQRAAMNAYFGIVQSMNESSRYNKDQILTRNQFYSAVYRAGFPVTELNTSNTDYYKAKIVTDNNYSKFTSQLTQYGWLNPNDGSLNSDNVNQAITKLEAYYLIVKLYFPEMISRIVDFGPSTTAFGYKNAGTMITDMGFNGAGAQDYYELNVLGYMSQHPENGLDEEILRVMKTAELLGLASGVGSDLFSPITKDQTIQLLINAYNAETTLDKADLNTGYLTTGQYGIIEIPEYEYAEVVELVLPEEEEVEEMNFEEPLVISEELIQFIGDKAEYVDQEIANRVLVPIADYMVRHDDFNLLIIGTTAGDGNSQTVIKLSEDRAETVKNTLIDLGVNANNLITLGMGSKDPWHIPNLPSSSPDYAKNRKVVLLDATSPDALHILGLDDWAQLTTN